MAQKRSGAFLGQGMLIHLEMCRRACTGKTQPDPAGVLVRKPARRSPARPKTAGRPPAMAW